MAGTAPVENEPDPPVQEIVVPDFFSMLRSIRTFTHSTAVITFTDKDDRSTSSCS
jgi:hypothetical protein